jgi:hypothetical protein
MVRRKKNLEAAYARGLRIVIAYAFSPISGTAILVTRAMLSRPSAAQKVRNAACPLEGATFPSNLHRGLPNS